MPRFSRERVWTVFLLALALSALVTVVRHRAQAHGKSDVLSSVSRRVLFSPALEAGHSVANWWQLDIGSLFDGPRLAAQNQELRRRIAELMEQNRTEAEQSHENIRLRALLQFKASDPRKLLPAEVLALKPFSDRDSAMFSRGSDDHVVIKEPAIDENGNLVGQVTAVSATTSDVMLLTDTLSSAGARVVASSAAGSAAATSANDSVGICVGDHSGLLQLGDLSWNSPVKLGDLVVTSGLGGIYPKDIPIGKVVEVKFDQTRYLKSAVVAPAADFNHLEEGFLLR